MDLGAPELLVVLVIALFLFGGAKLPKIARSIGQASTEFKKGLSHEPDDGDVAVPTTDGPAAEAAADDAASPAAGSPAAEARTRSPVDAESDHPAGAA